MYNTFTPTKLMRIAAATFLALTVSTSAVAGPGKPGKNELAPGGTIVDVAFAANDALGVFNTVLAAATCDYFDGAVADILAGDERVTLFAPVDSAFAELGLDEINVCEAFDGSDDAVGAPGDLLAILAYHVADGRRFSNSLFNSNSAKQVEMLAGGSITTSDGKIYDNNMREVLIVEPFFNINASNGVIHVINRVLLP